MHLSDCGCSVTERESCGSCWCFWWYGFADSVRSPRLGDTTLKGNYDISNSVHADIDFVVDYGDPEYRRRRKHDFGTASSEDRAGSKSGADPRAARAEVSSRAHELDAASPGKEVGFRNTPQNAEVAELADALA